MKKGLNHNGNRGFSLKGARRVTALVLALLMPANPATVLAEAVRVKLSQKYINPHKKNMDVLPIVW